MAEVIIVAESDSFASDRGLAALQQAIGAARPIKLVSSSAICLGLTLPQDAILCPLTLNLPDLTFPGQAIYQACRDVDGLRDRARPHAAVGAGSFWLPIVLTAKGALYAEAIAPSATSGYHQPLHLTDRQRQPLYHLAQQLLQSLSAPPAVYLLQFGFQADQGCFDRLIPFPDTPSIASLDVQTPNLYECHWRCLTGQPIKDLQIDGAIGYETVRTNHQ